MFLMSGPISWDDQRVFLAVLEEGSLSGAARRLGVSHPTVRSRLEALEAALSELQDANVEAMRAALRKPI